MSEIIFFTLGKKSRICFAGFVYQPSHFSMNFSFIIPKQASSTHRNSPFFRLKCQNVRLVFFSLKYKQKAVSTGIQKQLLLIIFEMKEKLISCTTVMSEGIFSSCILPNTQDQGKNKKNM